MVEWGTTLEPRILEGFALTAQMSSKKVRSKKPGTLTRLVEKRSDVTPEDLRKFFDKQSDLHSPVWLLIVGLLLGGGSIGFVQFIREASSVPSTLPTYLLLPYLILFIILLFLVPLAIGLLLVYVVKYNPFSAQERIMEDYLDARAKLKEKSKLPDGKASKNTTLANTTEKPEEGC